MPNRVLPRRELFFVIGKAVRGKWRKMKWKVSIMTRWSTYRLIINSQMPLNVNFFCGDWRIAIVTEEWKVIELFLILSIAARGIITQRDVAVGRLDGRRRSRGRRPRFFRNFLLHLFDSFAVFHVCTFAYDRRRAKFSCTLEGLHDFCPTLVHNSKISLWLTIIPHDAYPCWCEADLQMSALFQATKMFSNPPRNLCLISQKSCNWMAIMRDKKQQFFTFRWIQL